VVDPRQPEDDRRRERRTGRDDERAPAAGVGIAEQLPDHADEGEGERHEHAERARERDEIEGHLRDDRPPLVIALGRRGRRHPACGDPVDEPERDPGEEGRPGERELPAESLERRRQRDGRAAGEVGDGRWRSRVERDLPEPRQDADGREDDREEPDQDEQVLVRAPPLRGLADDRDGPSVCCGDALVVPPRRAGDEHHRERGCDPSGQLVRRHRLRPERDRPQQRDERVTECVLQVEEDE